MATALILVSLIISLLAVELLQQARWAFSSRLAVFLLLHVQRVFGFAFKIRLFVKSFLLLSCSVVSCKPK